MHLLASVTLAAFGRSLHESLAMLVETGWALVLGFALAGALQAFARRDGLRRALGSHSASAVARAAGLGMASTSCSYAAAAMAKSLFQLGADFVTAMVFMVASTNLVIELGIVLVVLIGWQFALSEFVGGAIMIVLLVVIGGRVFSRSLVARARRRAPVERAPGAPNGARPSSSEPGAPGRAGIGSLGGWVVAATYTVTDLKMVAREMAIGYLAAGLISTMVPVSVFDVVLVHGHGLATSLENVAVAPLIAMVSCVCSIGNVPLAAALWKEGISFGGVVAFLFADLVALPLLLVYRRYYGAGTARRMLAVLWLVMSLAGLFTEGLFRLLGLVPRTRPRLVAPTGIAWDATSILDLACLVGLGALVVLYRYGRRSSSGTGYAIDPVCGMQVEIAHAPATFGEGPERAYLCGEGCRDRYRARVLAAREVSEGARPGKF